MEASLPDYDAVLSGLDEIFADEKALADSADALAASLRSPWKVLQDEVDRYTAMLDQGLISQEQFGEAVRRSGKDALEASGGLSPHVGQGAVITERRQYGAMGGGDSVPSLLKQQLKEMAGTNRGVQKLLDSGGLG